MANEKEKLEKPTDDIYHERLATCADCPLVNKIANGLVLQCSLCKCEMHLKARLARKKDGCPDGRWSR